MNQTMALSRNRVYILISILFDSQIAANIRLAAILSFADKSILCISTFVKISAIQEFIEHKKLNLNCLSCFCIRRFFFDENSFSFHAQTYLHPNYIFMKYLYCTLYTVHNVFYCFITMNSNTSILYFNTTG